MAFFFIAVIVVQTLNLLDWVLKKLGFFKTTFEKALSRIGYSQKYYNKNSATDIVLLQKLEKELQRMKDDIEGHDGTAFFNKQLIDFDLEQVSGKLKSLENSVHYNSLESTKERLKNLHNLVV